MKPLPYALAIACLLGLEDAARAQGAAGAFQITKLTKNLITTPQIAYTGAQQYTANQREPWLEVEVEFTSTADFTDDLTCRYFILINGKVLTGEVSHTNVASGKGHRSVMYVPPLVLTRFNANRPVTPTSVQNIAVQIVQGGAVKDEVSLTRAAAQWHAGLPQAPGFLLNKNDTPFASLYWDRYEQIKAAGR